MKKELIGKLDVLMRIVLLIAGLSFGMVILISGAKAATSATLRSEAVITGDYIKLGDIFDGTRNADYVLGPAPQPGKDMILNAKTLYKIASALDVDWRPQSAAEQIVLRREAAIVRLSQITNVLEEKIRSQGVKDRFSLVFNSTPGDIILPSDQESSVEVADMRMDVQNDLFNAVLVAPSADNPVKKVTVSGRIEREVPVPVLKNALRNGDIISAQDIDWVYMPQEKIASDVLTDEKSLIDMTPRRLAHAGKPLSMNDLERPKMVDRGDAVTLIFENGPMVLTAKGKALQIGALGDTVRVTNADSNKSLQGTVTAHREVTIR